MQANKYNKFNIKLCLCQRGTRTRTRTERCTHTLTKLSLGKQTWPGSKQKLLTSARNKQLQRPGRSLPLLPRPFTATHTTAGLRVLLFMTCFGSHK